MTDDRTNFKTFRDKVEQVAVKTGLRMSSCRDCGKTDGNHYATLVQPEPNPGSFAIAVEKCQAPESGRGRPTINRRTCGSFSGSGWLKIRGIVPPDASGHGHFKDPAVPSIVVSMGLDPEKIAEAVKSDLAPKYMRLLDLAASFNEGLSRAK